MMPVPDPDNPISETLRRIAAAPGADRALVERLYDTAYDELKKLARIRMRRERPDHTLQPTALVNEAYLKLVAKPDQAWETRAHFLGAASRAMAQVLIDHAAKRGAAKRGGSYVRVPLETGIHTHEVDPGIELTHLARLIAVLRDVHDRAGRVFEMRIMGGMTIEEVASALSVSRGTVVNDWRFARFTAKRILDVDA